MVATSEGVEYERKFEEIDGLGNRPDYFGNGGSLRRIEVAEPADSRGPVGVVHSKTHT
jgi:hypothetical protein